VLNHTVVVSACATQK